MGIAELTNTSQSGVVLVDRYCGCDGVADTQPPEYVHPDESGEKEIAKDWYDAVTPYLSATSTPAPTPVPTTVPITPPTASPRRRAGSCAGLRQYAGRPGFIEGQLP